MDMGALTQLDATITLTIRMALLPVVHFSRRVKHTYPAKSSKRSLGQTDIVLYFSTVAVRPQGTGQQRLGSTRRNIHSATTLIAWPIPNICAPLSLLVGADRSVATVSLRILTKRFFSKACGWATG